ncbi:sensor domain-containing diguanylate cyclase [Chitinimonas sp. PSY-7]|uniref:diguanylate cyclase n=1 Tax=Chitinimonas sp. PSY-7 TaxID=3459088 RepID=UPI0040400C37
MRQPPPNTLAYAAKKPGWRGFVRARRILLLWLVSGLGVLAMLIVWELRSSYMDTRQNARVASQSIAQLLKEQLEGAFRATDLVLRDLAGKADPVLLSQLESLSSEQSAKLQQILGEKLSTLPPVASLAFLPPYGRYALNNRQLLTIDPKLQRFFLQLLAVSDDKVAFSEPFAMYNGEGSAFLMVRRVPGVNQKPAGLVSALVKLEFFEQLVRRLNPQSNSSFVLYDSNLRIVGLFPKPPGVEERLEVDAATLATWINGRNSDYGVKVLQLDGVERGYSFFRLENFPFVVMVGLSEQQRFSDWRMKAAAYVAIFLMVALFSVAMAWRGWRESQLALEVLASQQRLQAHDEHILRALETLSRPILLVRARDNMILVANEAAAQLCGQPSDMLAGRLLPSLYEEPEQHTEILRQLNESQSLTDYELKLLRPGQASFWAAVSGSLIVYTDESVYFLTLADISERKLEQESLWLKATLDPLTGIANRGYFMERALVEWQRAVRYQRPLGVLMLDIDHFKHVNDTYGHDVGDEVLQALCQRVQRQLRETDLFGRLGGEEFCVLLPEEPDSGIVYNAERLRQRVAETPIRLKSGTELVVTMSVGCACLQAGMADLALLIKQADQALYAAKRAGRNRVVLYDASTGET